MKNSSSTKNVHNLILEATESLHHEAIPSARLDALLLLAATLGTSKHWLLTHPEHQLDDTQDKTFWSYIQRRIQHEPVAYILGTKEFYGRDFITKPGVLVPRPETEDIVALALTINIASPLIYDVGTGSGIIGITIALEKPNSHVVLTDVSGDALAIAEQNVAKYGLRTRITLKQSDLLKEAFEQIDILAANLPYVPESMRNKADLTAEPAQALFSGDDGMAHYRTFFNEITQMDNKPTHIITESLLQQHSAMSELALAAGYTPKTTQGLAQHFTKSTIG